MTVRPALDDAAIRELSHRLIGNHDLDVSPVQTEGMEVQARRLTSGDQSWCLRLGTSRRSFAKDHWAQQTLSDRLPIPRVLKVGQVDDQTVFCLSEWKEGQTLQDLSATEVERTLPAVFDVWSMINTGEHDLSQMGGAGDFDPRIAGSAPSSSWQDDLRSYAEQARGWTGVWPDAATELTQVIKIYERLIDACPDQRDLVHGDFGCNNMLVADGQVTAVLDWEAATIGDPLVDISGRFWATHPPVATCVTRQACLSDHLLGDLPDYQNRVLCYDLRTGLSEINSALTESDHKFAAWALNRCFELATS